MKVKCLLSLFIFSDCSADHLEEIIMSLNKNKSNGPNSIPTFLMKAMAGKIAANLHKIINLSLNTGKHPKLLKISKTIPIFKQGSRLQVSNYRPISLLSNINKIFEKVAQVYTFLE